MGKNGNSEQNGYYGWREFLKKREKTPERWTYSNPDQDRYPFSRSTTKHHVTRFTDWGRARQIILQFAMRTVWGQVWKMFKKFRICIEMNIQFREDYCKGDREAHAGLGQKWKRRGKEDWKCVMATLWSVVVDWSFSPRVNSWEVHCVTVRTILLRQSIMRSTKKKVLLIVTITLLVHLYGSFFHVFKWLTAQSTRQFFFSVKSTQK